MQLLSVYVAGFRNVDNVELSLDKINALVGLNSFGKSNVIDAIRFGFEFITADKEQKHKMMMSTSSVPLNKLIQSKNFSFSFKIRDDKDTFYSIVEYGYEFVWVKSNRAGSYVNSEWMKARSANSSKFSQLINRNIDNSYYKSSITGRCSSKIEVESDELIVNKLLFKDDYYNINIIKYINNINIYSERNLDASPYFFPDLLVHKDVDELNMYSASSIPRLAYYLKQNYTNKYDVLIDSFMQLFPQITKIEVEERDWTKGKSLSIPEDVPFVLADKTHEIIVEDSSLNQPIKFSRLSDGCKRVFLLLTCAVLADIKDYSLITIEEPENSVHPGLLQKYVRVLSQLTNNCKILMASHSPHLVQYLDPGSIYIGLPNESNLANFMKFSTIGQRRILREAQLENKTLGEYVFELLSGSKYEHDLLASFLI